MKANNFSKKFNGQMQLMGKGGIRQMSNSNSVQPNYQKPMKKQQSQKNNQMNNQINNKIRNNNNNYNYNYNYQQPNNYNKKGSKQSRNNYENSKNQNNINKSKNSILQRNAKMILNNNSNINNRQKAKSAKKYVDNNNRLNDMYYQGGKGNYNMGINNLKYSNNNNRQKMQQIYNNQYNSPQYNNNQYINQYNNQNNSNFKLKNNNNNNARTPKVNRILNKSHDYQFIEFQPYTLKDYKELTRNPVVMRPLGANIGTKEWEFKKNKMKKMQVYSNIINKEHKGIVTLKKDSPQDEIEKLTKQKIENSNRFKASEYSKLVRAGKFKDDTNVPNNMYDNYGNQDDNDLLLRRYEEQLRQETENMNKPKEVPPPVVEEKVEPKNLLDIDQLLKQKQDYQHKIKDIRDTLLD